MARKKVTPKETTPAPVIDTVEVVEVLETTTTTVCSNCDDSGKDCSVCGGKKISL